FNGPSSFPCRATDGLLYSNVATMSITVTPVNDPPPLDSQSIETDEDNAFRGIVTGDGGDAEVAQFLAFVIASLPQHGLIGIDPATGAYSYLPLFNYNGPDSFTITVTDDSAAGPPFALTS